DIHDARPLFENRRRFYSEEVDDPLLKRMRVAETTPGVTRVVLELADGVEATPSQLSNPHRLMIELRHGAAPPVDAPPQLATTPVSALPLAASAPITPPSSPKVPLASVTSEPSKVMLSEPASTAPPIVLEAKAETSPPLEPPSSPAAPSRSPNLAETAKSARHTSSGQSSLVRALGLKVNRIVIDPGHGGHDQGTSGPKGLLEKELVLDVSLRLGKLIEDRMGAEVIYTRTDDTFIPLEGRTALANDKKADLFLSIHANSSPAPQVSGIETYYLNFTDSKDALDLAARENASSERSVFELKDLLQRISLHDKAEESHEFANRIQTALYAFSARTFPAEKNRGVRKAPFVVLIGANMPSVLAEIGFLSNPKEEALLKKPDYRQKLAEALYRGVSRYVESLSHYQMALN
ncbi:MAG: N-acetylmuramoyl-L-alanine amidase, partial [Acidobacteriia bacterium]|nr:N-acetylmuramoyl-L-alanine amidase [Terriglobia bacterium]